MPYRDPQMKLEWQRQRRQNMSEDERARMRAQHMELQRRLAYDKQTTMSFCAVDGEGGGTDELGRQNYLLLRAGTLLFENNRPLNTSRILAFLSALPHDKIYVAFYFDYDVTMILRELPFADRSRILLPKLFEKGRRRATYYKEWELDYLPHKYFRVKHVDQKEWITINDVGPFFQCSFVKALEDWQIGSADVRREIAKKKSQRSQFEIMSLDEIRYNKIECDYLEMLMEDFRTVCIDTDYLPRQWQGPGWLATRMLERHKVNKKKDFVIPSEMLYDANTAYYGGRFEITRIGNASNVYECDINSAYPDALQYLPCLIHSLWQMQRKPSIHSLNPLSLCSCFFRHAAGSNLGGLPIRDTTGTISWPLQGNGIYWGWEINAALQAGADIQIVHQWQFEQTCYCKPFDWIAEVYQYRKSIGKSTKGFALKLAMNSLYGKMVQSIGKPQYANPIWGGLITSFVRAKLFTAAMQCPDAVVMLATDGVYTTQPLNLPIGDQLGEWEHKHHKEMFFVQSGIYFSTSQHPKTRGVPMAVVLEHEQRFRDTFTNWLNTVSMDLFGEPLSYPSVEIPMNIFIGLKLAQHRNKPELAGKWDKQATRNISYDFRTKRRFAALATDHVLTQPRTGSVDLQTTPYRKDIGRWRQGAADHLYLTECQPDFFAFGPDDGKYLYGS